MRLSAGGRLFLSFLFIQLISAVLIVLGFLYTVHADFHKVTVDRAQEAVLQTIEVTEAHFRPAERIAGVASRLLASGVLSRERPEQLERYLFEQLTQLEEMHELYVGYPDGTFHEVVRDAEVSPGGVRTKAIEPGSDGRTVEVRWRDADFAVVKVAQDPADPFDPRSRGWYRQASEVTGDVWTEPHVLFASGKPGITLATAVRGPDETIQAVIGLDFEISAISEYLSQIVLGLGGSATIVSREGQVIAHSGADLVTPQGDSSDEAGLRLRKVSELEGPGGGLGAQAHQRFVADAGARAAVATEEHADGRDYFVAVGHMEQVHWPWLIVVVARKHSLVDAAAESDLVLVAIVLLVSALATAIGYAVSRTMGRSLQALRRNAVLAQGRNLEVMSDIVSPYAEINETDAALRDLARVERRHSGPQPG